MNCTHEHILRLLPPFILRAKDVTEFLKQVRNRDGESAENRGEG